MVHDYQHRIEPRTHCFRDIHDEQSRQRSKRALAQELPFFGGLDVRMEAAMMTESEGKTEYRPLRAGDLLWHPSTGMWYLILDIIVQNEISRAWYINKHSKIPFLSYWTQPHFRTSHWIGASWVVL
jgi:hypothetical protein